MHVDNTQPADRPRALLIGNSDGIGRAICRQLLDQGRQVIGISRSDATFDGPYQHLVHDVRSPDYKSRLASIVEEHGPFGVCIYCVGIGEALDPTTFEQEAAVFEANLLGAVLTASVVIPSMLANGGGHFVGISSLADDGHIAGAPSYSASKAGLSNYLKSLALSRELRQGRVFVTNVRFGFVDTKMAKSERTPGMISPEKAARLVIRCLRTRPIQLSYPKSMGLAMRCLRWLQSVRIWLG